jgi:hypothetical protein
LTDDPASAAAGETFSAAELLDAIPEHPRFLTNTERAFLKELAAFHPHWAVLPLSLFRHLTFTPRQSRATNVLRFGTRDTAGSEDRETHMASIAEVVRHGQHLRKLISALAALMTEDHWLTVADVLGTQSAQAAVAEKRRAARVDLRSFRRDGFEEPFDALRHAAPDAAQPLTELAQMCSSIVKMAAIRALTLPWEHQQAKDEARFCVCFKQLYGDL